MMNRQNSKKELININSAPSNAITPVTPVYLNKKNPSKPKETPKVSHSPIIYSNKAVNSGNIRGPSNSKVNITSSPYLNKNANEMIKMFSDDRYREIKDVNIVHINLNENDKKKQSSKNLIDINLNYLRPSTPQHKKGISLNSNAKINNFVKETSSGKDVSISNNKKKTIKQNKKIQIRSSDQAIIMIQRTFRTYINKIRSNPKYQMASLLKKKKLSILKNYNIVDIKQSSESLHLETTYQREIAVSNYNKTSVIEEDKVTANFGKNLFNIVSTEENYKNSKENVNNSRLTSLMEEKDFRHGSDIKDNFIDDYESFLSYKKYTDNKDENFSVDFNIPKDKLLDKLKKSLDNYNTDIVKKSDKQMTEDDLDLIDIINHKEQTGITKNDISDTVNVYEKIFKEIKKEKQKDNAKIISKNANVKTCISNNEEEYSNNLTNLKINETKVDELQLEELDSRIINIEKNISKINKKYNDKSSLVNFKGDKDSESIIIPVTNTILNEFKSQFNESNSFEQIKNNKYISNIAKDEEKKKMVDRLNEMLETEDIKNNIQSKLNISNTESQHTYKNIKNAKDETVQSKINKIHSILDENSYIKEHPVSRVELNHTNINTAEVLNLALELKESKKTVESMKEILEELNREIKTKEEIYKREIQEKTSVQKYDFDNVLQRQNGLIESLLSEKKKLTVTIDELSEKLEGGEKINHKKLQHMIENFDLELKKNKDAWFQAEKMRRKKWEEQKVKEIKEVTVKGLEPEIERILSSQKQEITKMEDRMNEELRRQRDKLNSEYERRAQDTKERSAKDKEEALEHERTLNGQRIRNQNERLEEEYNEERRRWNAHFAAEIERLESLREKDKKLYEDQISKIEDRNIKLIDEKESYYKLKIGEMEKRFEDRIKDENENYTHKFEKEKDKFIEAKVKEYEFKTKETKNELIKDRDKQIQIIIEKLGDETINERKKIQLECERKANEVNKSLKIENEQMKAKMQELSDKVAAESKVRLMLDDNLDVLSRKLQDKEREISKKEKQLLELNSNYNDLNSKYSNILKDFNHEKLDIELNFKSKLQKTESDFKLLNDKLDSVKNYYESKINDIHSMHKNEIIDIEEKIKKTLNRKDDVINKLQEESQYKDITIQKYEEMLAKQRKELLINNNQR